VGFDNRAAMAELARAVLDLGHRDLALISAEVAGNDRAMARLSGLRDAMQTAGLPPDALAVIQTPYGIENGATAFDALMQRSIRPTAVMCGNDVLAVGALRRARELGLDVPGDVSITGFDDIELAQVAVPALATVQVPHREMGRRAARALMDMVEGKKQVQTHSLAVQLRLRGSLGPSKR
ncbi:MAG: substrate-binding domain-containing protein, partial [Sedimentitalea sp.]